ncbi:thiamine monophosphate synthase [Erythrobacter sp. AP23]|nr:thiamine monophosphate synthase [Erythrobacter sp. AP23]
MAPRYSACVARNQSLPLLWLLSDARNDALLETALRALPEGSGFVFRHYHLDPEARRARFEELATTAHSLGHTVILSGVEDWGADGHYGPPERLGPGLRLATAHDGDEMHAALEANPDAIFLSPVFPTASHPGAATLGVERFHALARQSRVPVIALGGMTHERARELDWPRWGAIDGLGSSPTEGRQGRPPARSDCKERG